MSERLTKTYTATLLLIWIFILISWFWWFLGAIGFFEGRL